MKKEPIENWEKLWSEFVVKEMCPAKCGHLRFKLKNLIKRILAQEKTPKGVCKNCWNRGYSTQMIGGTIVYGDFIGDKDYKTKAEILIKFCNCENGKQLKSMIEEKIKESKQKWDKEKCMAINKEVAKESYEEFIKPIIAKEKHQYRQEILDRLPKDDLKDISLIKEVQGWDAGFSYALNKIKELITKI
jgi:hypothetical protein